MKRKAKLILATAGVILLLPVVMLFLFMKQEGYPTLAGVRNIFQRDGQIRIELPPGYSISEVLVKGDEPDSIVIANNIATIRIGYSLSSVEIRFETGGKNGTVRFGEIMKLNNWNRITFRSVVDQNGHLGFDVDENGVSRTTDRYVITQTTEQAVSSDGHKPSSRGPSDGPAAPADAH